MNDCFSKTMRRVGLACVLAVALGANGASAGTATGTLTVTATVVAACLIGNSALVFGTYNPTAAAVTTATTTVALTCPLNTPYNIGMSAGAGTGATTTLREMTGPTGGTLGYRLFRDAAYSLNWGNTVGTDTLAATSSTTSLTNVINIYAQIPANEAVVIGAYTDSVVMTVTY